MKFRDPMHKTHTTHRTPSLPREVLCVVCVLCIGVQKWIEQIPSVSCVAFASYRWISTQQRISQPEKWSHRS